MITIKLSTGKVIELTIEEYNMLRNILYPASYGYSALGSWPWTWNPNPWPTVTCDISK